MTEHIRRCNAAERRIFNMPFHLACAGGGPGCEPALGTLDEKLAILVRRHGGRTRPFRRLTEAELIEAGVTIERPDFTQDRLPETRA